MTVPASSRCARVRRGRVSAADRRARRLLGWRDMNVSTQDRNRAVTPARGAAPVSVAGDEVGGRTGLARASGPPAVDTFAAHLSPLAAHGSHLVYHGGHHRPVVTLSR